MPATVHHCIANVHSLTTSLTFITFEGALLDRKGVLLRKRYELYSTFCEMEAKMKLGSLRHRNAQTLVEPSLTTRMPSFTLL